MGQSIGDTMKIVWISDLDFSASGYFNVSIALCDRLTKLGHDVKVIGLGYKKEEHTFNFPIIPAQGLADADAIVKNMSILWNFDVLIVAFDIWMHEQIILRFPKRPFKYYGIMPVESDPLCLSWGMVMLRMDKAFIISQFGTDEAEKIGVNAQFMPIGIDTDAWRIPTQEERETCKLAFGLKDKYVVLTVADNQERKNLSRSMEIFADFSKHAPDAMYVLLTREHAMLGWKLREYAQELGISDKVMVYERGLPFKELWGLYAASDCFLLTAKAEGAGLPIMEAMAAGLPCIGTDCTGIHESLADGRGLLIPPDYVHRDPFGNGRRYFASRSEGARLLNDLYAGAYNKKEMTKLAHEYISQHTWDKSADIIHQALLSEKKDEKCPNEIVKIL
jgi:glycosyltransferase involved in cell wall biosynthesis